MLTDEPLKMPVCPYCKQEMTPTRYSGYFDSFYFWACKCENLKSKDLVRGDYE